MTEKKDEKKPGDTPESSKVQEKSREQEGKTFQQKGTEVRK